MSKNFKDLYEAVKKCGETLRTPLDRGLSIQVYRGCSQVNVKSNDCTMFNILFGNISDNEVGIVTVRNEIADYDRIKYVDADQAIKDTMIPGMWKHAMESIIEAYA